MTNEAGCFLEHVHHHPAKRYRTLDERGTRSSDVQVRKVFCDAAAPIAGCAVQGGDVFDGVLSGGLEVPIWLALEGRRPPGLGELAAPNACREPVVRLRRGHTW